MVVSLFQLLLHVRVIGGNSKLTVGVNVSMHVFFIQCLCVGPVID